MTIKQQLIEQRHRLIREVGLFAAHHSELTFSQVGKVFGVHPQWVSRAARAVGQPARQRGRKRQHTGDQAVGGRK
jgi:hypothetical protein